MQREGVANVVNWLIISIHAPLTGCDSMVYIGFFNHQYFNHTHPSWGATVSGESIEKRPRIFQSTHPSWGATENKEPIRLNILISIHAPIVGCDKNPDWLVSICLLISIHAPIVGCDLSALGLLNHHKISIHAPIVGCDVINTPHRSQHTISIHAPIVGCDYPSSVGLRSSVYFNPRTHRGVRQRQGTDYNMPTQFQSTHPSWGATIVKETECRTYCQISIHAPIVGCDKNFLIFLCDFFNFNPRTHRGVRP